MSNIDDAIHGKPHQPPEAVPAAERRPGEALFALFLLLSSLALLWDAYGIAGFSRLSSAGAIPLATTAAMVLTSGVVLFRALRAHLVATETVWRDILPPNVIVLAALLVTYGVLLRPLGFLPTSALFLIVAIRFLSGRSWIFTLTVSLGSLLVIWILFRVVFSVLMPAGIVPEAEFMQFLRTTFGGGAS